MPVFEYKCKKCSKVFEMLIYNKDEEIKCPACNSKELTKLISGFATISSSSPSETPSCGPDSCPSCQYGSSCNIS